MIIYGRLTLSSVYRSQLADKKSRALRSLQRPLRVRNIRALRNLTNLVAIISKFSLCVPGIHWPSPAGLIPVNSLWVRSAVSPARALAIDITSNRHLRSLPKLHMEDSTEIGVRKNKRRGAFILLEGVDRCGKTTQAKLLEESLEKAGTDIYFMRFPDRTTAIGQMINSFLQSTAEMDDRCVHLLFSANRWESESKIRKLLEGGTTIVCDRYAYSGVAFSASKPGLSVPWCKDPDRGLPAPDKIVFLDISVEDAMKNQDRSPVHCIWQRGQFGEERYEKEAFQRQVRSTFMSLMNQDKADGIDWLVLDANRPIRMIQDEIKKAALEAVKTVEDREIGLLWSREAP